jgi:hypothetical protein
MAMKSCLDADAGTEAEQVMALNDPACTTWNGDYQAPMRDGFGASCVVRIDRRR